MTSVGGDPETDTDTDTEIDTDTDTLWSRFETVGLDEIVATADLQTRKDRKYLIPFQDLVSVLDEAVPVARILTIEERRAFLYRSTYFDTVGLDSYLGAARRRPERFKVRTRHYVDSATLMLEVKTRNRRGLTVKRRRSCTAADEVGLGVEARAFIADSLADRAVPPQLVRSLTSEYSRSTLVLAGDHARVTIDVDVTWLSTSGQRLDLGPAALVETKTDGKPCSLDRMLWSRGHRPIAISKYATGLAALHPHLPANKWNRTLRHHFDWRPVDGDRRTPALPR